MKLILLLAVAGCGGRAGLLDGKYEAALLGANGLPYSCGGDSALTMAGEMVLIEAPPGVLNGNVVLCGERSPVIGQVDAAGGFALDVVDQVTRVVDGHEEQGALIGKASTPRGPMRFRADRK